jgi:hypothetical protein
LAPSNPYLSKSSAGTVDLTPQAGIAVVAGIDKLAAALAVAGQNRAGWICCAPETFERFVSVAGRGSLVGGKWRLPPFGHVLVSDAGFPGTGISGAHTTGKQWAFGIDPVVLERSQLRINPGDLKAAVDRDMNAVTFEVEQDCVFRYLLHRRFAIEVTL